MELLLCWYTCCCLTHNAALLGIPPKHHSLLIPVDAWQQLKPHMPTPTYAVAYPPHLLCCC